MRADEPLPSWRRATILPTGKKTRKRFRSSTETWKDGPSSSRLRIRNWKHLLIPSRTTCARRFAIRRVMRSYSRSMLFRFWMKRAGDIWGTILESAKHMGELIDDLLTFSRIGRAETQKTVVSMDQLVREVLTEVQQDTDGRKINWRIGPLANVYGDRSMLRVVLVNLISNAAKFT